MVNPRFQKVLHFIKSKIQQNPYIAKSIAVHVSIVIFVYLIYFIGAINFNYDNSIQAEASNTQKQMKVIQATSISNAELNKQIWAYKDKQQKVKQAEEDIKLARNKAIAKAEKDAQQKLIEEQKQEQIKKAELQKKAKMQEAAKKKAIKEAAIEKKRVAQEQANKKAEQERNEKLAAAEKANQEAKAKARAEAIDSARKAVASRQSESAISGYISDYQDRVGDNWIKDYCRGIYNLPRAIIRNGDFIRLTGTSGSFKCDQSLINAIKSTTPPVITNPQARQTIQNENVSFIFKQT